MSFGFRLLFRPLGPGLAGGAELVLPSGAVLRPVGRETFADGPLRMAIHGRGFATEAEAHECASRHRIALYLGGPSHGFPVDARDAPSSSVSEPIKDAFKRETGARLHDTRFGVVVFEEEELPPRWFGVEGTGTVTMANDFFVAAFAAAYDTIAARTPTEAEMAAIELYNLARLDASPRAQFMTLVSVVETLAEAKDRSQTSIRFLDECIERVDERSIADAKEREVLQNALRGLKRESINSACRSLVEGLLGAAQAKRFKELYGVRSKLSHGGPPLESLPALLDELRTLVKELLMARFRFASAP